MADELYLVLGTGITWTDTGGDKVLDLGALAANAVRVGAYHDWGASPRPALYVAEFFIDGFDTAPVVDDAVYLYISEGLTTTNVSGPETYNASADAAGSVARLKNMKGGFPLIVDSTTAANNLFDIFVFESFARYMAPVVYNRVGNDALLSTSDAHFVRIYPAAWQKQ